VVHFRYLKSKLLFLVIGDKGRLRRRRQQSTKSCNISINMAKENLFCKCVCENPKCFQVQADLCQLSRDGGGEMIRDEVWCKSPFQIHFDGTTASFKSWLFVLGLQHNGSILARQTSMIVLDTPFNPEEVEHRQCFANRAKLSSRG
jgi:hypothetical protein